MFRITFTYIKNKNNKIINNNLSFVKKKKNNFFLKRSIHTTRYLNSNDIKNNIKDLNSEYIIELYKNRKAKVKPFNKELILATCNNVLNKIEKLEFLKEWGSKSCIYLIQYKHDSNII